MFEIDFGVRLCFKISECNICFIILKCVIVCVISRIFVLCRIFLDSVIMIYLKNFGLGLLIEFLDVIIVWL